MSLMTERTRDSEEKKRKRGPSHFFAVDFLGRKTQQMRLGLTCTHRWIDGHALYISGQLSLSLGLPKFKGTNW